MKKWTKEEIEYILSLDMNNMDIYDIAKNLDRTLGSVCYKIKSLLGKDLRNSIVGSRRRAKNHYNLILNRLKNTHINKNSCYKDIKMYISENDFIEWFMKNDFKNASVDRIDKNKNYTIDNIQMLLLEDNIRKDKIKAKDGFCECYVCKKIKPIEQFAVDKRRKNGHSTICKICDNLRKYKNKKECNMITLELFKKIIGDIKKQEEKDDKLTELLVCPECTGWINSAEDLISDLIQLLQFELKDEWDTIEWWLYDISDGNRFSYDNNIKYDLNELDDLYYYLIGELDKVKQEPYNREQEEYEIVNMSFDDTMDVIKQIWEDK